ncbi:MAG TPA: UDP-N-acetylglucosamine 2-epimerase (non-hydrolyzing), partial [Candidatus Acidoferrum sp.]|nr:UDP-N-acetylglucosamine 2-epimerase (non-hydrolyzing) [Candidatus Acidoferrum sp.]
MKILSVVGARPQFIKAAPVSRVLRRKHLEVLVHTGQHYDDNMSDIFFRELDIPKPDINLGVGSGPHGAQTGGMMAGLEKIVLEVNPDWVLVYGDTNSTLAAALVAAKLHVPVAHVEAGVRSFDRRMPEEINRVVADHVSDRLLCPTEVAVRNLAREGVERGVRLVGDVMYDAFLFYRGAAAERAGIVNKLGLAPGQFALATLHRAENADVPERLRSILEGIVLSGLNVVLPLHPRTRARLEGAPPSQIHVIDPVGYLEMLALEEAAALIVTDSGGVQKEAYFLGKPCITLRDSTEWTET